MKIIFALLVGTLILPVVAWAQISEGDAARNFPQRLAAAALERTKSKVRYDGSYVSIAYPNGDVSAATGVCTDVIIRSLRTLGIDLQQLVHEDMKADFDAYPSRRIWGLQATDTNIDHRRVPNLRMFFRRQGLELPLSQLARNYQPGDIVTWILSGNLPHIGIVSDQVSANTGNPLVVHNIGAGPVLDDSLFSLQITGHYRYPPPERSE